MLRPAKSCWAVLGPATLCEASAVMRGNRHARLSCLCCHGRRIAMGFAAMRRESEDPATREVSEQEAWDSSTRGAHTHTVPDRALSPVQYWTRLLEKLLIRSGPKLCVACLWSASALQAASNQPRRLGSTWQPYAPTRSGQGTAAWSVASALIYATHLPII